MLARFFVFILAFLLEGRRIVGTFSSGHFNREGPHVLKEIIEHSSYSLWSLYLPTEAKKGSACHAALNKMLEELSSNEITTSHKIIDSIGKFGTGFAVSYPIFLGVYDECRYAASANSSFSGRYCLNILRRNQTNEIEVQNFKTSPLPPWLPKPVQGTIITVLNGTVNRDVITYATCIPDTCRAEDLQDTVQLAVDGTDWFLEDTNCHLDYTSDSLEPVDIVYIVTLSLLAALLLSASVVDIYIQRTGKTDLRKGHLQWLLPFSAYTNIQKLFHINTESPPGTISCLHCMRVLSMTWVVWSHQQGSTFVLTSNLYILWRNMNGFLYQTLLNGYPSVDSFFFMSGLLMSYNVMKEFKRSDKFNVPVFYLHRILRLVPPILLVVGLYATIARFFLDGPTSAHWEDSRNACVNNWWIDVALVGNFQMRFDKVSCLGQCWYLGADTQVYLVAPLILLPILYKEELGMLWLFFVTMVSIIVPAVIDYVYNLPPTELFNTDTNGNDFDYYNYLMPWCRAGPIIIGIWLGIFLQKQGTRKVELQPWQVVSGWTVAVLTGFLVVYGVWSYNKPVDKAQYDVMTQIIYGGLHRPAWGAALAWVVFACYNGYGGFINTFLSHPVWQPMSRLTYSIYLVAMPMQYLIALNTKIPYYYSQYNKILETVGAVIVSIIPSILVSITAESPILAIEKLIFKKPSGAKEVRPNTVQLPQGIINKAFEDKEHYKVNQTTS